MSAPSATLPLWKPLLRAQCDYWEQMGYQVKVTRAEKDEAGNLVAATVATKKAGKLSFWDMNASYRWDEERQCWIMEHVGWSRRGAD